MDMEIAFYLFSLPLFSCYHLSWEVPPLEICCHTRLHLASFSLQDGATEWLYDLAWTPPHPPTAKLFLSMLCGFPTPIFPSSPLSSIPFFISPTSQPHFSHISTISQPYLSHISTKSQPYLSQISTKYQPYIRHISAISQPNINPISAISQPYLRNI